MLILQMLYKQGMIIPNHINNKGLKPILLGSKKQVESQLEYIYRGNYGLCSVEEIMATGVDREMAEEMMKIKLMFAFGKISSPKDLLETKTIEDQKIEIRNGVHIRRDKLNEYTIEYKRFHIPKKTHSNIQ